MSISPPSDIVFDVAKAADPQKYRAAVEKLARSSGVSDAEAEKAVADAIDSVAAATAAKAASAPASVASTGSTPGIMPARSIATHKNPHKEFEAFFLQTFVESMLPKESETLFGSGPAGNIWKSMLAEHLANELAQGTAFGIAEQIAAHRKDAKAEPAPASALAAPKDSIAQAGAAQGYLAELKRMLSADGDRAAGEAAGQSA